MVLFNERADEHYRLGRRCRHVNVFSVRDHRYIYIKVLMESKRMGEFPVLSTAKPIMPRSGDGGAGSVPGPANQLTNQCIKSCLVMVPPSDR